MQAVALIVWAGGLKDSQGPSAMGRLSQCSASAAERLSWTTVMMARTRADKPIPAAQEHMPERYRHIRFFDESALAPGPTRRPIPSRVHPVAASTRDAEPVASEVVDHLAFLLRRAGVDPGHYHMASLSRRVGACLRSLKARSLEEARSRLEQEPERLTGAVSTILIGVTEFFRDPHVFACLDEVVLPKLAAGRRRLRVWSAGCADGAELYSVAMLLARRGLLGGSTLVGTDCRPDVLCKAERGWFDRDQVERLPLPFRAPFLVEEGSGGRVCGVLRRAVCWRQGDILAAPPADAPCWDLILCRNVAIYLEPAASALLWSRLLQSLRVGGVLVVGKAERPDRQRCLVRLAPCVFEKRE